MTVVLHGTLSILQSTWWLSQRITLYIQSRWDQLISRFPSSSTWWLAGKCFNRPSASNSSNPNLNTPRKCAEYERTGACKFGARCRYQHDTAAADTPEPLSTPQGLERLTNASNDIFFSLNGTPRTPSHVNTMLRRFLKDDFHFTQTNEVYGFLTLLCDATSNNSSWSPQDGQLLLSSIARDNGLSRINDILAWEKVSARAGNDRAVLSFQRGYVPLLQYLSSDYVVKSVLSHLTNALYALLMEHFEHFAGNVQTCMNILVPLKSFDDPHLSNSRHLSGGHVFALLSVVLLQCLTRFKNACASQPQLPALVLELWGWLDLWIEGVSDTTPTFRDPITTSPSQTREQICAHLSTKVGQLKAIVEREKRKNERKPEPNQPRTLRGLSDEGILAALHNSYEGPGELRPDGPRHDNDHVDISDIRIAPTHQELKCRIPPFLPANIYGAPHPYEQESMERLLDIQFRLLREELIASLRKSVQVVLDDLESFSCSRTQLSDIMRRRGGKYRANSDDRDTILFNVYTNAEFHTLNPDRRGLSVTISVDTPPGRARVNDGGARAAFWESMSSKRLLQGGLIALVWQTDRDIQVHLGVISSSLKDLTTCARECAERISIRISFFDPEIELRILNELHSPVVVRRGTKFLVEATVMFESIRPFLEALRVEPTTIPLSKYIVQQPEDTLRTILVDPPKYARLPGFTFELNCLCYAEAGVDSLKLNVNDPTSVQSARQVLRDSSRLDPSQADAVVDALTRELVLVQGPPGTGKSYTGVELLRVLLANKAGPILMIAFTNHALDHMLGSVLDAKITTRIVRLGSRSSDERIASFSLENLERVSNGSRNMRFLAGTQGLRDIEAEVERFMKKCLKTSVDPEEILKYIEITDPSYHAMFTSPPPWISLLCRTAQEGDGEWVRVGKGQQKVVLDNSVYTYWLNGGDLEFLQGGYEHFFQPQGKLAKMPTQTQTTIQSQNRFEALGAQVTQESAPDSYSVVTVSEASSQDGHLFAGAETLDPEEEWMVDIDAIAGDTEEESATSGPSNPLPASRIPVIAPPPPEPYLAEDCFDPQLQTHKHECKITDFNDVDELFYHFGIYTRPEIPVSERDIGTILQEDDPWILSFAERQLLHQYWSHDHRVFQQESNVQEFERLRVKHANALKQFTEGKDAARCELLRNVDIIGCTTNGAANLTAMLKSVGPRIMLVEEAGQVLEAHVLGSLVPSIQHLILIGDPLQLRPTINNYSLSVEHRRGGLIYKFDMSLMERLATSGLSMSQINVQRRMRPAISNLVRSTLYPALEDHDLVKNYPPVRGMGKNTFFLSHTHKENGGDDESLSKYNQYEVDMAVDLVMYLLRQGPYSAEGDIVVLCGYLGQLARMRDAFANKVAVVIDEQDKVELADREAEREEEPATTVDRVRVTSRVLLRTIDNYQGEEAKIVILSLVRNSGGSTSDTIAGHSNTTRANIGFLRSENRTNVALSRAREGMYILGNAPDLASRSPMWQKVLDVLEKDDCIGNGFPIVCNNHPDTVETIAKPGQLQRIAPDGGCLRQCGTRLKCGHLCPFKCHSDDPNHVSVLCEQRCTKLCPRGHPCTRTCSQDCGKCVVRIPNVELPCGHIKYSVACHHLDDLSIVQCDVKVARNLPTCEHQAEMRCSDDPADILCKVICGETMPCCGRLCSRRCSECQRLHERPAVLDLFKGKVTRTKHATHPCQKLLYCEHVCGLPCSTEHRCATSCRSACRQVCPHARCRQYCSTPCAPCQERCTWMCEHHACPLPCGSVCSRLPCDLRCKQTLRCGHQCPSVCGEDCSIQVCPLCAPAEVQTSVVDFVLQRTLAEIRPDEETLDELLITLPDCKHVFTVETLDGHCQMSNYYRREGVEGRWVDLEVPPSGFLKPPVCPTCRSSIRSPRYGRAFKRANLDILENNIASHMSKSIGSVLERLGKHSVDAIVAKMQADFQKRTLVITPSSLKPLSQCQKERQSILKETRNSPTAFSAILPTAVKVHGLPPSESEPFRGAASVIFSLYRDIEIVANTRSSHIHAWEAAYAFLYEQAFEDSIRRVEGAPRDPNEHAMRVARMRVGQPQPRADKRFHVEAFWVSINLRLMLATLAKSWLSLLSSRGDYPGSNQRLWDLFISFILRTCAKDVGIALSVARQSESHRQVVKTYLVLLRVEFEQFRWNVDVTQRKKLNSEKRHELASRAEQKAKEAEVVIRTASQEYRQCRWSDPTAEADWLNANFVGPSELVREEWRNLQRSLRMNTFYQPVSLQEMTDIVKALDFGHTGHFYKCPNGHSFVIGECGGAMEQSICPECGASIGGSAHRLLSTNSRDHDLERLAASQGARGNPWAGGV